MLYIHAKSSAITFVFDYNCNPWFTLSPRLKPSQWSNVRFFGLLHKRSQRVHRPFAVIKKRHNRQLQYVADEQSIPLNVVDQERNVDVVE